MDDVEKLAQMILEEIDKNYKNYGATENYEGGSGCGFQFC